MSKIGKALSKAKQESAHLERSGGGKILEVSPTHPEPGTQLTLVQQPRRSQLERHRVLNSIKDQHVLDAYNLLRTQILQKTAATRLNSIMVTSPGPGEGKTTTAINLGLSLARNEQYTALVVDMHLRSPKLHHYLDMKCSRGVTDYLLDGASIAELLVSPNEKSFVVLPSGNCVQVSTEILSSKAMKGLVHELKTRYSDRYVLFDCPHLLNMPDALVFSRYVDAVLLVVEADRTTHEEVQKALKVLEGQRILGLVLNKYR